jgi:hypothetical protein
MAFSGLEKLEGGSERDSVALRRPTAFLQGLFTR